MSKILKNTVESLQHILKKFFQSTYISPSKYIRIASYASSFLISWSCIRWSYIHLKCKLYNYPPCTYTGIPILGSMIYQLISTDVAPFLMEMGQLGPINMFILGRARVVYLNDMHLIKHDKVFKNNTDRYSANLFTDGYDQFFLIDGKPWHHRRRIASNAFLNQLHSKKVDQVYRNVLKEYMFPRIDKYHNKIYKSLRDDLRYLVFTLIYSISLGPNAKVPAQNDPILQQYFELNELNQANLGPITLCGWLFGVDLANWINHNIFNRLSSYHISCEIVQNWIEKTCTNNKTVDNYYVQDMLELVERNELAKIEMERDTFSMFAAGVDSTIATLEQGFFYLIKDSDMQERVYNELKRFEEEYGEFSLEHIHELHILRAFVHEVLRNIKNVLNSFPRYVVEDTVIGGYNIGKGWYLMANHFYVNHSQKYWEKPMEFYIEHFLDENKHFKMNKNMISFGVGRRDCVGQSLALKNLYVLFGHFILRYKLLPSAAFKVPEQWMNVVVPETPIIIQIR